MYIWHNFPQSTWSLRSQPHPSDCFQVSQQPPVRLGLGFLTANSLPGWGELQEEMLFILWFPWQQTLSKRVGDLLTSLKVRGRLHRTMHGVPHLAGPPFCAWVSKELPMPPLFSYQGPSPRLRPSPLQPTQPHVYTRDEALTFCSSAHQNFFLNKVVSAP